MLFLPQGDEEVSPKRPKLDDVPGAHERDSYRGNEDDDVDGHLALELHDQQSSARVL